MAEKKYREILCGSVKNPPGYNLWIAVGKAKFQNFDNGCTLGIPPQNLAAAEDIMKRALTKKEAEILAMGFGINRSRVNQGVIKKELNLPENENVSGILKVALKKLTKAPYFGELKALVPTAAELYSSFETHDNQRKLNKQLQKMGEQIDIHQQTIAEKEKIILEMSEKVEENERRSAAMRKQLDDYSSKNLELMKQLAKYQSNFSTIEQICDRVNKSTIEVSELQLGEHFPKEIVMSLNRAGVYAFDGLLASSRRNLIAMKVRKEFVDVIEDKLRQMGLKLRGA